MSQSFGRPVQPSIPGFPTCSRPGPTLPSLPVTSHVTGQYSLCLVTPSKSRVRAIEILKRVEQNIPDKLSIILTLSTSRTH